MARVSKHLYYNIDDSDISLSYNNLLLYFSSDLNAERFKSRIIDYINLENSKLKVKYNVDLDLTDMLIISYYNKVEKRGFRIYKEVTYNDELCLKKVNKDDIIKSKVGE